MREIIFRGKHNDNGEWIIGGYYHGEIYNFDETDIHYIIPCCDLYDEDLAPVDVIPETVGQFTGLTDKNGKRIFEGDIITAEPDKSVIAVVKYNESKAAFYVENENAEDYLGEAWDTDVVVIGNVFDNNELLKGE